VREGQTREPGALIERGHPVRPSAKREQRLNEDPMRLMSVLRTLADKDVRAPSALLVLPHYANYLRPCAIFKASGNWRSLNIEITPNKGPGARITKA
jgi:hypothetical protein